jgi:hypothetical protein
MTQVKVKSKKMITCGFQNITCVKANGGNIMRIKQGIKLDIALVLLLAAVTLVLPTQALSATIAEICASPAAATNRSSGDGFTDLQKCTGLIKSSTVAFDYPSCYSNGVRNNIPRDQCLDPASKDLFVELVPLVPDSTQNPPAPNSVLPDDPLKYISCPVTTAGCLGITVHRIGRGSPFPNLIPFSNRDVIVGQQKMLRVTESASITGKFGYSVDRGVPPTGPDEAKVYTYQIKKYVNDLIQVDSPDIYNAYIRHTIAHEIGHGLKLWITSNVKYNGYHMPPATPSKHMEDAVKVQGVVFFLPTQFDASDIKGFAMQ